MVVPNSPPPMAGLAGEITDIHLRQIKLSDYLKIAEKLSSEQKSVLAVFLARNAISQDRGQLDETESIIQIILWNSDIEVAESIAGVAALGSGLSRPLVWMLANDDERVAAPVLEKSLVLTDEDLMGIIEWSGSRAKMNSIARRPVVTESVSRSLVSHGDESTAMTLLENSGAQVSADAFNVMVDRFGELEQIQSAIVRRDVIFPLVAQRLLLLITNPETKAALAAREIFVGPKSAPPTNRNVVGLDSAESEQTLAVGVDVLLKNDALTEPVLVELLLDGSFELFVRALARRAQSDPKETRHHLIEATADFLPTAWTNAGFSAEWLLIAKAALLALIQLHDSTSLSDPKLFRQNLYTLTSAMIQRDGVRLSRAPLDFLALHRPK
jgi:uncharacterized protein (DUF2336 family)